MKPTLFSLIKAVFELVVKDGRPLPNFDSRLPKRFRATTTSRTMNAFSFKLVGWIWVCFNFSSSVLSIDRLCACNKMSRLIVYQEILLFARSNFSLHKLPLLLGNNWRIYKAAVRCKICCTFETLPESGISTHTGKEKSRCINHKNIDYRDRGHRVIDSNEVFKAYTFQAYQKIVIGYWDIFLKEWNLQKVFYWLLYIRCPFSKLLSFCKHSRRGER